jgi:hypothetical protein
MSSHHLSNSADVRSTNVLLIRTRRDGMIGVMRRLAIGLVVIGSGVAVASPASKPKLSFGDPIVADGYDAKAVQTTFKKSTTPLLACYQKALAKDENLTGNVTVTFAIGTDGKVVDVDTTGVADTIEACIANVIAKLKFAKPKEGAIVAAIYPLTFDVLAPRQSGQMPQQDGALVSLSGRCSSSGFGDTSACDGNMGGRPSDIAIIWPGQPNSTGDLDRVIIRRYVRRNIVKLEYCYEKQLAAKPGLAGTMQTHFTISANGIVRSLNASGVDPEIAACMAGVINHIEFPRPKQGDVDVNYPFTLRTLVRAPTPKPPQTAKP